MTRCLRVRVGRTTYLLPSGSVGAIALYPNSSASGAYRRVIDARRMSVGGDRAAAPLPAGAVAIEWIGGHGRVGGLVLVDEVQGLVDIDSAQFTALPHPARALALLFDGFWYDTVCAAFLLRVRTAKVPFAELRRLARMLAPLTVAGLQP
jgi:hypothetical protein